MTRRRVIRTFAIVAVAVAGVLLIAGCTGVTGGATSSGSCTECHQLLALYPWLKKIGMGVLWYLVQQYGPDIVGILSAALAG